MPKWLSGSSFGCLKNQKTISGCYNVFVFLLAHDTQSEGMFAKLCVGTMTFESSSRDQSFQARLSTMASDESSSRDQSFQARLSTSCFKQALDRRFEGNLSHHPHSIYVSTALKIFSMLSSGMCSQSSSMCMSVHYTSSKCISFFECCKEDPNILEAVPSSCTVMVCWDHISECWDTKITGTNESVSMQGKGARLVQHRKSSLCCLACEIKAVLCARSVTCPSLRWHPLIQGSSNQACSKRAPWQLCTPMAD